MSNPQRRLQCQWPLDTGRTRKNNEPSALQQRKSSQSTTSSGKTLTTTDRISVSSAFFGVFSPFRLLPGEYKECQWRLRLTRVPMANQIIVEKPLLEVGCTLGEGEILRLAFFCLL